MYVYKMFFAYFVLVFVMEKPYYNSVLVYGKICQVMGFELSCVQLLMLTVSPSHFTHTAGGRILSPARIIFSTENIIFLDVIS
jgi:hypothetical protein